MKFSILIANYNNGKFFYDCYLSLIHQTYENWEGVIVDDGSTDDSLKIITEIIKNDSRFRLYKNDENKGCGFTKRKCMTFAAGEICAYLDPDDTLEPVAIEESIKQYKKSNIVATYSQMMMCDEKMIPQKIFSKIKGIDNTMYFFNCPIQMAHFFTFRKETYHKTPGINPKLKSAVDQDLYLKILEHGDIVFIGKALYNYRLHSNGISQEKSKQSAKDSFAGVILDTMKRRGIRRINNMPVPDKYLKSEEIFQLLNYQNGIFYRLKKKFKLLFK